MRYGHRKYRRQIGNKKPANTRAQPHKHTHAKRIPEVVTSFLHMTEPKANTHTK